MMGSFSLETAENLINQDEKSTERIPCENSRKL